MVAVSVPATGPKVACRSKFASPWTKPLPQGSMCRELRSAPNDPAPLRWTVKASAACSDVCSFCPFPDTQMDTPNSFTSRIRRGVCVREWWRTQGEAMPISSRGMVRALVLFLLSVLVACSSNSSSTNAGTGILLAASQGNSTVASYQVNLNTGILTQQGGEVTTGSTSIPTAILLTPSGDAAFVANRQTNDIARFSVNSDATVSAVTPNQPASSNAPGLAVAPVSMATDSGGKFLFVANQTSDTISIFSISGTSLTEVAGSPFPTTANPTSVAVAPNSNFVYVTNDVNGTVSGYVFDSTTGAITASVPGSPYAVGASPSGLAFATPQNGSAQSMTFLYVTNFASNNVHGFATCVAPSAVCLAGDGSLVSVGSPVSAGLGPIAAAVASVE